MADNSARLDGPPHPDVYQPWSFVCGPDAGGCLVTFGVRPPERIAAALLEQVGDWHRALRDLPDRAEVPAGVAAAVDALHEAVAGWTEILDARVNSHRRRVRAALDPSFHPDGPATA